MSPSFEIDFDPCFDKKNLLAFSAGIDSSALFFLLVDAGISFDISIVNYNSRASSSDELAYAQALAKEYKKEIFYVNTSLENSGFEEKARKIRYDFFESIIDEHHYDNLLTGHQMNDQLEWFLMQLTKGAGTLELLGMQRLTKQKNYTLVKPLLKISKEQLQAYLDSSEKKYFIDESNSDQSFKRNHFRHNFSDALIKEYHDGIARSFSYLEEDRELLLKDSVILTIDELSIIKSTTQRSSLYHIDKELKRRGYILSAKQRQEIEKNSSVIISDRFVIEREKDLCYIAPKAVSSMEKVFKEQCRLLKIPQKIRPYLFEKNINLTLLKKKLSSF